MIQQHSEQTDRVISYAVGTGGVVGGTSLWGGAVNLASDMTIIVGFITALVGLAVVSLRLYRDLYPKKKKK